MNFGRRILVEGIFEKPIDPAADHSYYFLKFMFRTDHQPRYSWFQAVRSANLGYFPEDRIPSLHFYERLYGYTTPYPLDLPFRSSNLIVDRLSPSCYLTLFIFPNIAGPVGDI